MATYNGYHSIDIFMDSENVITGSKKNTWNDFRLVAEKRPSVNPPEPKSEYIDVPGRNGSLDYSDILGGYPTYNDRTGSWDFIVVNDFYEPVSTHEEWYETYSKVMAYIQGKKVKVILEDDLEHYYRGRLHVSDYSSGNNYSTLTIEYHLEPFKYSIYSTNDADWLWDPFNFYTGTIPQKKYMNIELPSWNRAANGDWSSRNWKSTIIDLSDIGTGPVVPIVKGWVRFDNRHMPWSDRTPQSYIEGGLLFQVPGWSGVRTITNTELQKGEKIPEYTIRPDTSVSDRTVKCCCRLTRTIPTGFFAEADMPYHVTKCENCNRKFDKYLLHASARDPEHNNYTQFTALKETDSSAAGFKLYLRCESCRHKNYLNNMFTECPNCGQIFNETTNRQGKFYTSQEENNYKIVCRSCNHEYTRPYAPEIALISIDVRRSDF